MKGPRELKRYIAKHRSRLKAGHWDDLRVFKLQDRCRKWRNRRTKPLRNTDEWDKYKSNAVWYAQQPPGGTTVLPVLQWGCGGIGRHTLCVHTTWLL